VNSIEDKDSGYFEFEDGQSFVTIHNEDVIAELLKYSFEEVGEFIYEFSYEKEFENWDFGITLNLNCKKDKDEFAPSVKAIFRIEPEEWNKPYSIFEFSKVLSKTIASDNETNYKYFQNDDEVVSNGFGILFSFPDIKTILSGIVVKSIEKIEEIIDRTTSSLVSNLDKEAITTFFVFPDHIKTACKQYLIYFAQFLMDIGIEAETEIKEEAHKTLFKVIPKDNNESLGKIKDALLIYLNAPSFVSSLIQTEINNDVSVMQWKANILHLNSQLMFANSILQLKDATIQSLQLSNYQFQQLIQDKGYIKESDDEEEIIKGVVSLSKYEGKGFSVNFAEIFRRLKRTFK